MSTKDDRRRCLATWLRPPAAGFSSPTRKLRTEGGRSPNELECGLILTSAPLNDKASDCNSISAANRSEPVSKGNSTNNKS